MANPKTVKGIDRSEDYVEFARSESNDPRAGFEVGNAQMLSFESETFDVAVSGLVLNFVPQPDQMIAEMARRSAERWNGCAVCLGLCREDANDASFLERGGRVGSCSS